MRAASWNLTDRKSVSPGLDGRSSPPPGVDQNGHPSLKTRSTAALHRASSLANGCGRSGSCSGGAILCASMASLAGSSSSAPEAAKWTRRRSFLTAVSSRVKSGMSASWSNSAPAAAAWRASGCAGCTNNCDRRDGGRRLVGSWKGFRALLSKFGLRHTHTSTNTHPHAQKHIQTPTHTHTHRQAHAHTHTYTQTLTHTDTDAHTHTRMHTHTHRHKYTQARVHANTHTHLKIQKLEGFQKSFPALRFKPNPEINATTRVPTNTPKNSRRTPKNSEELPKNSRRTPEELPNNAE